jgi:hypothetical protein
MWYHRLSGDDVVGNEPIKAQVNYFFKKTTREVYESNFVNFVKVHNYVLIKNFKTWFLNTSFSNHKIFNHFHPFGMKIYFKIINF